MANKGYTLVELLAVLAILGLFAGLAALYLSRRDKPFALRASAHELASCLRRARANAIASNRQTSVTIDLAQRRFGCPGGAGSFPPDSRILFRTAASEYVRDGAASLRFFADGGSTGGAVFVERRGQLWAVRTNWLTGAVRVAQETAWSEETSWPEAEASPEGRQ